MKILKYTLLLFFLTSAQAFAQKGLHIGVDGAFNGTFIINQNIYKDMPQGELEYAPSFGYTFGFATGYNFTDHVGIQAEIKTSRQGQKYEDIDDNGKDINRHVKLNYTHIPILFKFSGGGDYAMRFYAMAGPQFSFLNSAHETYSDANTNYSVSRMERFNKRDLQLVFDLGSDFVVYKNIYASTGLRFNYGLWDINAEGWKIVDPSRTENISQNALGGIHFGLHYVFGPPVEVVR